METAKEKQKILIVQDVHQLARHGAEFFVRIARESVKKRGRFSVAFSGGSTPRPMNRLLAREPYVSRIPWKNTHLFMVDERMLPLENPESNFGALKTDLLQKVPVAMSQLHPMPVWMDPLNAAAAYIQDLESSFGSSVGKAPVFDLVLLGVGKDGHTASLFPGTVSTLPGDPWVLVVRGGHPNVFRLTLNFSVFNHARHICFLVSGPGKANIVRKLLAEDSPSLPARQIEPVTGTLTWILDEAAAALLPVSRIRSATGG